MSNILSRNAIGASIEDLEGKRLLRALCIVDTVAAAGTTQATAALINNESTMVTGADAVKGVILPVSEQDMQATILNVAAAVLNVYPAPGESINALAVNVAYAKPASVQRVFFCDKPGHWYVGA